MYSSLHIYCQKYSNFYEVKTYNHTDCIQAMTVMYEYNVYRFTQIKSMQQSLSVQHTPEKMGSSQLPGFVQRCCANVTEYAISSIFVSDRMDNYKPIYTAVDHEIKHVRTARHISS